MKGIIFCYIIKAETSCVVWFEFVSSPHLSEKFARSLFVAGGKCVFYEERV